MGKDGASRFDRYLSYHAEWLSLRVIGDLTQKTLGPAIAMEPDAEMK